MRYIETISKLDGINRFLTGETQLDNGQQQQHNNTAQHHGTITHLVLELLHRLELFYGKQQTSWRNEIRVIA